MIKKAKHSTDSITTEVTQTSDITQKIAQAGNEGSIGKLEALQLNFQQQDNRMKVLENLLVEKYITNGNTNP